MHKMQKFAAAAVALITAYLLPPAAADASVEGETTADVNLRAGPGTRYPRIQVLRRGMHVEIHGCLSDYSWCDVSAWDLTVWYPPGDRVGLVESSEEIRGWVYSRYLDIFYDNRRVYVPLRPRVTPPVVVFTFGYWDEWYPRYPWYRDRWRYGYDRNDEPRRGDDDEIFYPPGEGRRNDRRNDGERSGIFVPRDPEGVIIHKNQAPSQKGIFKLGKQKPKAPKKGKSKKITSDQRKNGGQQDFIFAPNNNAGKAARKNRRERGANNGGSDAVFVPHPSNESYSTRNERPSKNNGSTVIFCAKRNGKCVEGN